MIEQIPHSSPWITNRDIEAVASTLSSLMIAQGDKTRMLERRLASWLNAEDGVGVASGSAATVLALRGIGVGPGDEVILPTYVCRSVLQAILSVGGKPVLCDVGSNWVMTEKDAKCVFSDRTRAIIVPHVYGIFADIDSFRSLGVPIIEDCAQALDASGKRSARGDIAILSFHPTKCLTSGEGGMAISSEPPILERMRAYRDGSGTNCMSRLFSPLSDLAASLALSQLDRYETGLERRRKIAAIYTDAVESHCPGALNREAMKRSMYFRFPLRIPGGLAVFQKPFSDIGIQVRKGVDTLLHRDTNQDDLMFPVAIELFDTTISIPIYPSLSSSQVSRCAEALTQMLPRCN